MSQISGTPERSIPRGSRSLRATLRSTLSVTPIVLLLTACGGTVAPTISSGPASTAASAPAKPAASAPASTAVSTAASAAAKPATSAAASAETGVAGPPAGSAEHGKELFVKDGCYECHAYQGQGGSGTGPKLAPNPLPFVAFQAQVRTPRQDMPKYPPQFVSDQDLADIYAYLQSVPPAPNPSSIPLLTNR